MICFDDDFFFSNSWFNAVHVYIRQNAVPLSMDERGNFSTPSPFKLQVDRRPFIIFIPMSWKILGQIKRLSWNHHSSLYCFWQCIIFLFFSWSFVPIGTKRASQLTGMRILYVQWSQRYLLFEKFLDRARFEPVITYSIVFIEYPCAYRKYRTK